MCRLYVERIKVSEPVGVLLVRRRRHAFIYKAADGDSSGEFQNSAKVVGVEMCCDEIINVLDTGVFAGAADAVNIAVHWFAGACVYKNGLAQGSNNEGGAAADHVEKIDFEGPGVRVRSA